MASVADYDVRAAFSAIEEELIASMMRNLANHRAQEAAEGIQWSQWQVEQLAALERYKKRNRKRFGGIFSGINARIERAIAVQHAAGQAGQELSILQAAKTGAKIDRAAKQAALEGSFHDINDRKFNALLRATTQDMEKAEHAILRRANDAYRKVIFNAQVYANTGAGTYEKAVDMATRDFLRSGIQCVVYKDGSRHSLADYADMALRTASKRAYLQGEGEQRQAWGISTVIVNKRGGACPKCARFCGKVFIDDVWSGGKAEDGDYPLLSSAIQMGLYHPRCKDAHSTFFPDVTEVDEPWTPAELEQLELTEQRQQRQQHAQRQAERYDRLARYSLDKENRERYASLADKWKLTGQRQSGKIGDTDGYTTLEDVAPFDFNDGAAVRKVRNDFAEQHKFSPIEHGLVLSPNGKKYSLKGWEASVNTDLAGADALEGAIVIHNHPTTPEIGFYDSFSRQDFVSAVKAKTAMEIVVSGECQQAFLTPQDISPEDAEALYNQARYAVMERAFQTDKPVEYQQLEVMRELNRMGVLEFFEL